jgi:hypothetical protein
MRCTSSCFRGLTVLCSNTQSSVHSVQRPVSVLEAAQRTQFYNRALIDTFTYLCQSEFEAIIRWPRRNSSERG